MKKLGKFVFHTLLNILTGWVFAVKMLFLSALAKSTALLIGIVIIIIYFINPDIDLLLVLKYFIPAAYFICCVLSAVRITFIKERKFFYSSSDPDVENNETTNRTEDISQTFFAGMSKEDAAKEYKRLLKIYHPDNPKTGDAAVARMIIEKYHTMFA